MKKKGFTLVELLAVIAILAILVIVAMPNVLGMFNQAKSSTFVTEVQTVMDAAKTDFMRLQLENPGKDIEYSHLGENQLSLDGGDKYYYVSMDRYGNYKRVVVWDVNFCYDSKAVKSGSGVIATLEKTSVKAADLHNNSDNLGENSAAENSNVPKTGFCGSNNFVEE